MTSNLNQNIMKLLTYFVDIIFFIFTIIKGKWKRSTQRSFNFG